MIRTGIPVSVWEKEDPAVMSTAIRLLTQQSGDDSAAGVGDVLVAGGDRG